MKTYTINECFYSPQGEGARAGTMNVFLRFAGCNLQCVDAAALVDSRPLKGNEVDAGFFCDTDFRGGDKLSLAQVLELVAETDTSTPSVDGKPGVILTGGEPTLQLDFDLLDALKGAGHFVAIETNGTRNGDDCPAIDEVDWTSCSPKRGTAVRLEVADEVRVVIGAGEIPDDHGIETSNRFVSPLFEAPNVENMMAGWEERHGTEGPDPDALAWAIDWCKRNPSWRLSTQQHKAWRVR